MEKIFNIKLIGLKSDLYWKMIVYPKICPSHHFKLAQKL